MHDEARVAAEKLRRIYGDRAVVIAANDSIEALAEDTELVILTMDCGNLEHALDAASAANAAVRINPDIRFLFGVNGCKDDSRELDQIPEARETLAAFLFGLTHAAYRRLDIEHRALIAVAAGFGHREGTQLHVPSWAMEEA